MKLYQPLQERFLSQRRLHRRLVAQLRGFQPDPEKYLDKTVVIPFGLEQQDVQHDPQRVAHWRKPSAITSFSSSALSATTKGCIF